MRDKNLLSGLLGALEEALREHGMLIRGGFALGPGDEPGLPEAGAHRASSGDRTLLLVGNAGPDIYRAFETGRADEPDPLDRWTRRVIEPIAGRFNATPLFPSDGPPYLPFQRWAMRAEGLRPSPLGILIHPDYGLWHAYRAALVFDARLELPQAPVIPHPCDSCRDRPCLTACPVSAVTTSGYAVDNCASHVGGETGGECRDFGCIARRACPVGRHYAYPPQAMAFHMAAFLLGRRRNSHRD